MLTRCCLCFSDLGFVIVLWFCDAEESLRRHVIAEGFGIVDRFYFLPRLYTNRPPQLHPDRLLENAHFASRDNWIDDEWLLEERVCGVWRLLPIQQDSSEEAWRIVRLFYQSAVCNEDWDLLLVAYCLALKITDMVLRAAFKSNNEVEVIAFGIVHPSRILESALNTCLGQACMKRRGFRMSR